MSMQTRLIFFHKEKKKTKRSNRTHARPNSVTTHKKNTSPDLISLYNKNIIARVDSIIFLHAGRPTNTLDNCL